MLRNFLRRPHRVFYGDRHYSKNAQNVRSLRKFVEFLDQRHSSFSIFGLLLHSAMEVISVGLYVWVTEVSSGHSLLTFSWNMPIFIAEVALNIIFFLEWVALFFSEEDKKRYLVSWLSLVNAMTSIPMIALGIGAITSAQWRCVWVPMYLRVWWISDCICLLLDYPQIANWMVDIYREMARFFAHLFAVICTCVGTIQVVESFAGGYIDLYNSLYMMIVTFSTLGYGDVTVSTTPARFVMTIFVCVGISYFLPLFQHLALIAQMRQYYATYRRKWLGQGHTHVIICGRFSDLAVEILLRNFYSGWRNYISTCVVLMSPEEHSPEVRLIANLPGFKGRVYLMIGDPSKEVDLRRAGAQHADAIFLFGNTRSAAYYHDYDIVAQSLAVALFDPDLPQHIMLRRISTVQQIAPYAARVLDIERTVHHFLGLSMAYPGVIPLIINLLRTYEPLRLDVTFTGNWIEQYEYSLRNDLYGIAVPDPLRGCEFRVLVRSFFNYDITLIGILNAHNVVQLNPSELIPNAKKLIMIAKTMKAARDATAEISRHFEQTFGEEMLVAPDPDEFERKKLERGMLNVESFEAYEDLLCFRGTRYADMMDSKMLSYGSPSLENKPDFTLGLGVDTEGNSSTRVSLLQCIEDAFDFGNHFIVIDLSSAKGKDTTTRYAHESHLTAIAQDIYTVMRPVHQAYPRSDIVLLTNDVSFAPYFKHHWQHSGGINPVKYILGCGLNTADLRRCNLPQCAGCCVFFSGDISREGSTSAMSMLVVLSIQDILEGLPTFPVVVELEGLANLPLFPHRADNELLRSKSEIDFVFEPNFLIGNAISRHMLFPAVQRTYFMAEFIDVMDVLISGYSEDSPALSRLPLSVCEPELETYKDVVNYCLKIGFLPIALHRCIHDLGNASIHNNRFVLTNPPHNLPVHKESDVIFYLIPS